MQLTKFQRKTLESWRLMKPHGLTWTMGLRRLAPIWAILAALFASVYLIYPGVSRFVACFILGAMLRDTGYIRSARKAWPVSFTVIDWAKVDELLGGRNRGDAR
jgi:hypothetical protein